MMIDAGHVGPGRRRQGAKGVLGPRRRAGSPIAPPRAAQAADGMTTNGRTRVAIACQGGGSHTAFTAGVLQGALAKLPADVEVVALSGTSGGAICAALAWDALVRGEPAAGDPHSDRSSGTRRAPAIRGIGSQSVLMNFMAMRDLMVMPEISPYQLPRWGAEQFPRHPRGVLRLRGAPPAGPPAWRARCSDRRRRGAERTLRAVRGGGAVRRMPAGIGRDPGDVPGGAGPGARRVLGRPVLAEPADPRPHRSSDRRAVGGADQSEHVRASAHRDARDPRPAQRARRETCPWSKS